MCREPRECADLIAGKPLPRATESTPAHPPPVGGLGGYRGGGPCELAHHVASQPECPAAVWLDDASPRRGPRIARLQDCPAGSGERVACPGTSYLQAGRRTGRTRRLRLKHKSPRDSSAVDERRGRMASGTLWSGEQSYIWIPPGPPVVPNGSPLDAAAQPVWGRASIQGASAQIANCGSPAAPIGSRRSSWERSRTAPRSALVVNAA